MNVNALPQLLVTGLLSGSFYAMLAVSFGLIFSTTRIFHFAHALTFTVGGYAGVVVAAQGAPFALAVLVAALAGSLFGLATDVAVYRPLRHRGALQLNVFLASLGLLTAGQAVIQFIFGPGTRPMRGFPAHGINVGPIAITTVQILIATVSWLLIIAIWCVLKFTKYGLAIRGVESNVGLAEAFGVARNRIYGIVFVMGSLMAGVGGALFALRDTATPGMGLAPLLAAFVAAFIGGIGKISGAAIGGVLLGLLENLGGIFLPGYLQSIVAFVLLFIVLVIRPSGLIARAPA